MNRAVFRLSVLPRTGNHFHYQRINQPDQFYFAPNPSSYPRSLSLRFTSNMASNRKEYFVVVPDKPGMLAKRLEVRDIHLANLGPVLESGFLKVGGAIFEEHPKEGETPKMKGSMLVVAAESEQEIRDTLSKDIYATSGVWDIENMQITPFKSAIRVGL
ncbi:hypothetical protein VTO42DRAFT_8813 [Malbranchea cinnamomea]